MTIWNVRSQHAFNIIILTHHSMESHCIHVVRINGTLNNGHYMSVIIKPVALLFIRGEWNATFQQDNALSHIAGVVQTFLDTGEFRLLPCSVCSPNLSAIGLMNRVVNGYKATGYTR